jgi:ComF family protein
MLVTAANHLVRTFLAPVCAACHALLERPLDSPVCVLCWRGIASVTPPWCVQCGNAIPAHSNDDRCARCRHRPPRFDLARSVGLYDGSLRRIVHAFKYEGRRPLARPLALMMVAAGTDVLEGADAVIPVPLDPLRALRRGFNQADDLALHLGLPVWRVLRRRRRGPPQAGLPASRRHANVQGAFALRRRPGIAWLAKDRARALCDGTVVLVDDVMTTGATLDACSAVLIEAGVRSVRALTVARAVAGPHESPLEPQHP